MKAEPPAAPSKVERYHHGDLRRELLTEARRQVEMSGAQALSLTSLAKVLGVSAAAPYRHFADRDDLLAHVAEEGFAVFSAELDHAVSTASPAKHLWAIGAAYMAFGLNRSGLYQLMFASPLLARAVQGSPIKVAAQAAFDRLAAVVNGPPAARPMRALQIWVSLHGAVMLASHGLLTDNPSGYGIDDLLEQIA